MKLYEINKSIEDLIESITSYEGEDAQEDPTTQIEKLQLQYNEKVENICKYIRNLEGDEASIDSEVTRLTALKKSTARKIESLQEYLRYSMQQSWVTDLELWIFKIKLSPSYAMKVEDMSMIPDNLIKSSITLDNQSIAEYDKIIKSLRWLNIEATPERKVMLAEVKKWYQELDPAEREKLWDKVFLQTNYNLKIK